MLGTIGIRREDKNHWERRAPLAPSQVAHLIRSGVKIVIQPSKIRIFSDDEYARCGASVSEDLSDCGLVLAIKEIPSEYFRPGTVYLFFSHVSKGQPYNMDMLERILTLRASLLDYEQIVDGKNQRLVFFGNHAGAAGFFETLYALGKRLEWEGHSTPLLSLARPLEFASLDAGRNLLREVAQRLAIEGVGRGLSPLIVGFVGYGNVSRGAQECFDLLPHEEIAPERLNAFIARGIFSDKQLYKVVFKEEDIAVPIEAAKSFDLDDYYRRPERYRGKFEKYLPHLTVLINCIYWEQKYPRLVTKEWLRSEWKNSKRPRLRVIGDITCDIGGSIECTARATGPDSPVYTYLPSTGNITDGWEGAGVVVMAVDTLPAEVPREASISFGEMLLPYLGGLASADLSLPFNELALGETLKRSIIVHRGELTERYQYLAKYLGSDT
jgi:saccharopine dehydrogenase (NAD+, L-lysine-forming)